MNLVQKELSVQSIVNIFDPLLALRMPETSHLKPPCHWKTKSRRHRGKQKSRKVWCTFVFELPRSTDNSRDGPPRPIVLYYLNWWELDSESDDKLDELYMLGHPGQRRKNGGQAAVAPSNHGNRSIRRRFAICCGCLVAFPQFLFFSPFRIRFLSLISVFLSCSVTFNRGVAWQAYLCFSANLDKYLHQIKSNQSQMQF